LFKSKIQDKRAKATLRHNRYRIEYLIYPEASTDWIQGL